MLCRKMYESGDQEFYGRLSRLQPMIADPFDLIPVYDDADLDEDVDDNGM